MYELYKTTCHLPLFSPSDTCSLQKKAFKSYVSYIMTGKKVRNGGNDLQFWKQNFKEKQNFVIKNKLEITYNHFSFHYVFSQHIFSVMRKHILIGFNISEKDKTITKFPLKVICFLIKKVSLTVFAIKIVHWNEKANF